MTKEATVKDGTTTFTLLLDYEPDYVQCDVHGGVHPAEADYYDEKNADCSRRYWRRVFIEPLDHPVVLKPRTFLGVWEDDKEDEGEVEYIVPIHAEDHDDAASKVFISLGSRTLKVYELKDDEPIEYRARTVRSWERV